MLKKRTVPFPLEGPVGPVAPSCPVGPLDPVAPVDPVDPVDPVSPIGPVGPVGPGPGQHFFAEFFKAIKSDWRIYIKEKYKKNIFIINNT
jgi:hypothetical protein